MGATGRSAWTLVAAAIVFTTALLAPSPALAERTRITSFDGTEIVVNFLRAEGLGRGERAPTVLVAGLQLSGRDRP